MKKLVSIILAISAFAVCTITSYAKIITSDTMGISIYIDDSWSENAYDDGMIFTSNTSDDEGVIIFAVNSDAGYDIDLLDEDALRKLCEDRFSDNELAKHLAEVNDDPSITVTTDSVVTKFEYHNGIKYYRYEKAYTGHGNSRKDTPFYDTAFVTAKNGKIYYIEYGRNYKDENRFADINDLLNSISYEQGEIKINVNGNRINPDSAPIIIDGRTLVPIRVVAETMGYSVSWDADDETITIYSGQTQKAIVFGIGVDIAMNEQYEEIPLDIPPIIFKDRTYLPVRAVAESLDANVNWDGSNRIVDIWQ